jgi:hypothetical protein
MKLKTLLLGTAAAFAFVGGAQAADLSVAEPVDYVKVCDAFGAGYWYIPGSDTCLKIGGLVRFDVNFHSEKATDWDSGTTHAASWDFATEARVNVTAKSMTEYGPLTAFLELRARSNNSDDSNNSLYATSSGSSTETGDYYAYLDTAYLELGMLLAGRAGSVYDYSGGFNWDYNDFDADDGADQVRLTWAMSGFGIQLAIEDPRDRWGTTLDDSYSMPAVVGNISFEQGNWSTQLSGGFVETVAGSGFGAQIGMTFKLDAIAPGDALLLEASRFAVSGADVDEEGSIWSAAASFQHFWAPTWSSAVTFQYFDQSGGLVLADDNAYSIGGNLVWAPVTGFIAGVEGGYTKYDSDEDGTWTTKVRLQRSW